MAPLEKTIYDLHVLFVEDDLHTRNVGSRILQRHVTSLSVAVNGVQGLALFHKEKPDLVISDIRMPEMDGLEMFRKIRQADPHVPLVVCSAHDLRSYHEEARKIGVDQYLLKPFGKEMLIQVLGHGEGIIRHLAGLRSRYSVQNPSAVPA